jgi:hypothetical protein
VNLVSDVTSISSVRDRRWLILGVIGLAQVMVIMSLTVMNIALLSAQRALHFTTPRSGGPPGSSPPAPSSAAPCSAPGRWFAGTCRPRHRAG